MLTLRSGNAVPAAAPLSCLLGGASLEVTAKDAARLAAEAPGLRPSAIFIPWLPGEGFEPRLKAAAALRRAGQEPVPHVSARRLESRIALRDQLARLSGEAGVTRLLLVAGDPQTPLGPYADSLSVIEDTDFAAFGIARIGLAGHPEGHPQMPGRETETLRRKIAALAAQDVEAEIVTQFSFDPDLVADWLRSLRGQGIAVPAAIGLPGPAKVATLLKFAARCGVGASARAVAKYGFSLSRLFGNAGPEAFVARLAESTAGDPALRLHIYPFGGFSETAGWLEGLS